MLKKSFILLLAMSCNLSIPSFSVLQGQGLAQTNKESIGIVESLGDAEIDWTEGLIKVTGTGLAPDRGNLDQKRLMAERAAIADAYRQLAEVVNGVRVNSETLVKDYVTESDVIKLQVSALIKGAQKTARRFLSDGSIEIDMVVRLHGSSSVSGIIQPQKNQAPPPPVKVEPTPATEEYSGIIVDCRGLGIQPAMSPAILNQSGGEVYIGQVAIDPEFVINNGIVGYNGSLNEARQNPRAGKNPLIVKGIAISGNLKADVTIAEKDTKMLLGLDQKYKLMKDAKVIFVM